MIDMTYQKERQMTQVDSRTAALHTELEATRAKFHALLKRVPNGDWQQKSPSSDWSIREVFVHLTWALEYLPKEVDSARRGRGMFNMPKWLADPMSYWYVRWLARTATPDSLGRRYDKAMDATISLLDKIPDADWKKGANFYGEGFHTVEDLFHTPAHHLAEHTSISHD